jgi:superfamily II DNA or RNA helicase
MKTYLYFLWHITQQISSCYDIFKIGSTKNLLLRMMTYKTSFLDFIDNKKTKLYYIEIDDDIRNAYYFDELLKEITKKIDNPYCNTYYDGATGGTEFYKVSKKESSEFMFILNVISKLIGTEHHYDEILIEELFKDSNVNYYKAIEQIYHDINESKKVREDLLKKDFEIIMNTFIKMENTILREWQKECLNKIKNMSDVSGVVIAPTGTGKSHLIIELMLMYSSYDKRIMYLTKRKEVLNDMFERIKDKIEKKEAGIILTLKDFKYDIGFMNFGKIENEKNKLKIDDFIKKYNIIIIDECHWAGSTKAFKFLEKLKKYSEKMIGFSATPLRLTSQNQQNNFNLFGYGTKLNIIYQLSYLDAIDNKYIMPLERMLMLIEETEVDEIEIEDDDSEEYETKIKVKSFNNNGKNKILQELDILIGKSTYKKCIVYFGNTKQLINFRNYYVKNIEKFSNLCSLKLYESYVKDSETMLIPQEFKNEKSNSILFVIKRCAEGFDDPRLEVGALGYVAKSYDPILLIQREGRLSRIFYEKITPTFITPVYNDKSDDFINNLVMNMAKLVSSFNTSGTSSCKEIDEIYKRFNEYVKINGELKISKEDFNKRVFNIVYGSENVRVRRYLIDLNAERFKNENELICTKDKVIEHLKLIDESYTPEPENGNWVKYSIGEKLFDFMKSKYYYNKDEIKDACHKLNIYDFDDYKKKWMKDIKLPNYEWINKGGFYCDLDEKFNIKEYFIKKLNERINLF